MKPLVLPSWEASRIVHLPNLPGAAPTEAESRVFEGVRAELAKGGPVLPIIHVPDVAAVFTSETRDANGRECLGLVVVLREGVR